MLAGTWLVQNVQINNSNSVMKVLIQNFSTVFFLYAVETSPVEKCFLEIDISTL